MTRFSVGDLIYPASIKFCAFRAKDSRISIMLAASGFRVYEGGCVGAIVSLPATLHIIPVLLSSHLSVTLVPVGFLQGGTLPCLLNIHMRAHARAHTHRQTSLIAVSDHPVLPVE